MRSRAQKITEALYRITDIFPDKEPLKWHLRKEGIFVFKIFSNIEDSTAYEREKYIDKAEKIIPRVINALELASLGTFISRTNFEILIKEYHMLLDFIKDKKESILPDSKKQLSMRSIEEILKDKKEKNNLSNGHISLPENKIEKISRNDVSGGEEKNHFSGQYFSPPINAFQEKGESDFRKEKELKTTERALGGNQPTEDSSERKDKIVSIVRERGEVSVSDVAAYFGGVSEKTIQRDLLALVDTGVIRKYGDKRWRRYVLSAQG